VTEGWTKIIPVAPAGKPGHLTCGGVVELNTSDFEEELEEWDLEEDEDLLEWCLGTRRER
jgi:hypothetical protein